jgi:hypothetical protein
MQTEVELLLDYLEGVQTVIATYQYEEADKAAGFIILADILADPALLKAQENLSKLFPVPPEPTPSPIVLPPLATFASLIRRVFHAPYQSLAGPANERRASVEVPLLRLLG